MNNEIVIEILVRIHIFKLCLATTQNVIVKTAIAKVAVAMAAKTVFAHHLVLIVVATTSN